MRIFLEVLKHFKLLLRWRFGLPEDGFGIFRWSIVEALVLPRFYFGVCQQVGIRFCWRILFLRLIRFCRNAVMNRPLPVGRVSPLLSWLLLPFSGRMLISLKYFLKMILDFSGLRNIEFLGWGYSREGDFMFELCSGGRWDWICLLYTSDAADD